jgi:hypothetical protein
MIRHFSHIRFAEAETFMLWFLICHEGRALARFQEPLLRRASPCVCNSWVLDDGARDLAHVAALATEKP